MGEKLSNIVSDMVRRAGYAIHMETPYCKQHKSEHDNCEGCESEPGCAKVAEIMLMLFMASYYESKNFEDYMSTQKARWGL